MERVSISLDGELLAAFDRFVERKGYGSRSEAVRDLVRDGLERDRLDAADTGDAVGCLSYVYNHHQRRLAERLTRSQHEHHSVILTTVHIHLDHDNCLEAVLMRGSAPELRGFAAASVAETGVRHGHLHLIAADIARERHAHGGHLHAHPKT